MDVELIFLIICLVPVLVFIVAAMAYSLVKKATK